VSLSRSALEEIRTLLSTVIQNVMKISGPSPSETVACLNIDWFEYWPDGGVSRRDKIIELNSIRSMIAMKSST
jgi:hypothetical protein